MIDRIFWLASCLFFDYLPNFCPSHGVLSRGGSYAEVTADDISFFRETIPGSGVLTSDDDDLASYNVDWLGTGVAECSADRAGRAL